MACALHRYGVTDSGLCSGNRCLRLFVFYVRATIISDGERMPAPFLTLSLSYITSIALDLPDAMLVLAVYAN
ncbi:MAG: hypothetical protein P8X79_09555 [Reinekea sp.]|jgi:hypothetical protein